MPSSYSTSFITNLDRLYDDEKNKAGYSLLNNDYMMYLPMTVTISGKSNNSFCIKKAEFTRFLYVKNGCRVYFSDADILSMLLDVRDKKVMRDIINRLKHVYSTGSGTKFSVEFNGIEYDAYGIGMLNHPQVLTNYKDIDIDFTDLLILINLVIAKDIDSSPLWPTHAPFFKKTICKYVSILEYAYFDNSSACVFLENVGYDINKSIIENYDTAKKRDEKYNMFTEYPLFEKMFEVC